MIGRSTDLPGLPGTAVHHPALRRSPVSAPFAACLTRRHRPYTTLLLVLTLVLSLLTLPTTSTETAAQLPVGWAAGLVDEDASPFEFDAAGRTKFEFWIRNDHMTAMQVDIEYDLPYDANNDGAEEMTIDGRSNDTITLAVTIGDPLTFDGGRTDPFDIEVTLTSVAGVPQAGTDKKSIDGEMKIPYLYELQLEITPPGGPMNSGTSIEVMMTIGNSGNSADSIAEVEVDDDCPLLSTEGTAALAGKQLAKGSATFSHEFTIEASPSHPDRQCTVEISIRSNGDDGWTRAEVRIEVEVGRTAVGEGGAAEPDGPADPGIVVQSNLPGPGAVLTALSLLTAAAGRMNHGRCMEMQHRRRVSR